MKKNEQDSPSDGVKVAKTTGRYSLANTLISGTFGVIVALVAAPSIFSASTESEACNFDRLEGTIRGSEKEVYQFTISAKTGQFRMERPAVDGRAEGFVELVCSDDKVSFMRDARVYQGTDTVGVPRTCVHFGNVRGKKVRGIYTCQEVAQGDGNTFLWEATLID